MITLNINKRDNNYIYNTHFHIILSFNLIHQYMSKIFKRKKTNKY